MECFHDRVFYYWRQELYGHVLKICRIAEQQHKNDLFVFIWRALVYGKQFQTDDALTTLENMKLRSDLILVYNVARFLILDVSVSENKPDTLQFRKNIFDVLKKANSFSITISVELCIIYQYYELAEEIYANSQYGSDISMYGWVKLSQGKCKEALSFFDESKKSDALTLYGKSVACSALGQLNEAYEIQAKLLTTYDFPEIGISRACLLLSERKWDAAKSAIAEIKGRLPTQIESSLLEAVITIIYNGNLSEASSLLGIAFRDIQILELVNSEYIIKICYAISTLCCGSQAILRKTLPLLLEIQKPEAKALLAYHHIYFSNFVLASSLINGIDVPFSIDCELLLSYMSHRPELEDQIQILNGQSFAAQIMSAQTPDQLSALISSHLTQFSKIKWNTLAPFEQWYEYIFSFRADLLTIAIDRLLSFQRTVDYEKIGPLVFDCISKTLEHAPGISPFLFYQSETLCLQKMYHVAKTSLENVLFSRWQYNLQDALIIGADIENRLDHNDVAIDLLDTALKLSSEIKTNSFYITLRLKTSGQQFTGDLIKLMADEPLFSVLRILDVYLDIGDFSTSSNLYLLAAKKVKTKKEKHAVQYRQVYLFAMKARITQAKMILMRVKDKRIASLIDGEIQLRFMNDEDSYIASFPEGSEEKGDAFIKLFMFNQAAEQYKKANVSQLKLATALIKSHSYDEAAQLSLSVIKEGMIPVNYKYLYIIQLLVKLKVYNEVELVVSSMIRRSKAPMITAELHCLLGEILMNIKRSVEAIKEYESAIQIFQSLTSFNVQTAAINKRISQIYLSISLLLPDSKQRFEKFQLAYKFDDSSAEAVEGIFNYYKEKGETEKALNICKTYLLTHPNSEHVALLLTSVDSGDYSSSLQVLKTVIESRPDFQRALVRLIEICARAGQLEVCSKYFNDNKPGTIFTRALYEVYSGHPQEAASLFRRIKASKRWGQPACEGLFQLLTNPRRTYIWCDSSPLASQEYLDEAEELLSSMRLSQEEKIVHQAIIHMSLNTNQSVSQAKNILPKNTNSAMINTAIAACLMRLGMIEEASKLLDRILMGKPFHETYPYFEECYLMKAQMGDQEKGGRKREHWAILALELNQSSKRAWEIYAETQEERKLYATAANAYMKCWKLGGEKDLEFAYKWANCELKANHAENAMTVCRMVDQIYPNYNGIKDKIMIPAFRKLRP